MNCLLQQFFRRLADVACQNRHSAISDRSQQACCGHRRKVGTHCKLYSRILCRRGLHARVMPGCGTTSGLLGLQHTLPAHSAWQGSQVCGGIKS